MTEVEELLMRIRGLVFAQAILEERGARASELEAHRLETERLRRRLAVVVANDRQGVACDAAVRTRWFPARPSEPTGRHAGVMSNRF
jgi:hypothetical protein